MVKIVVDHGLGLEVGRGQWFFAQTVEFMGFDIRCEDSDK